MPGIDLHCHTTASDGLCSPAELVSMASEGGLDAVAVTDHDTVSGVREASVEGRGKGVAVVAGIELSTREDGVGAHILGYFLDPQDAGLKAALTKARAGRLDRARRMVDALCDLGYELSFDEVLAQAAGGVVARPHVARALVSRGYVSNVRAAFTPELIGNGGRAYVGREEISPTEAIGLVQGAGGVAVLAHPGAPHHGAGPDRLRTELVGRLAGAGLAGLEADHPDHTPGVRDRLLALADELGLVPTGGSDFHGERGGTPLGTYTTSVRSFERLESLAGSRRG